MVVSLLFSNGNSSSHHRDANIPQLSTALLLHAVYTKFSPVYFYMQFHSGLGESASQPPTKVLSVWSVSDEAVLPSLRC